MSGLKTRNRKTRPHKNTHVQVKVEHITEISSRLKLREPLTILRITDRSLQRNREHDNTPLLVQQEQQPHNETNSDTTALNQEASIENDKSLEVVDLATLPQVRFTCVNTIENSDYHDTDEYLKQQHVQEQQLIAQNTTAISPIYKRPENHYVHYIEPSDKELYDLVEYDMDEQDKCWLHMYNDERRKEALDDISPYLLEYIMDKIEKEWFNMVKNSPVKTREEIYPEDSACAVCDDTEVENSNAIVFCDGCNVAVHQDCYGIPYIPEGQWLCRKCMISPEFPVSCLFCPNEGGAFKQTNTNQWGHLVCAIWIPEVRVGNPIYMEPIEAIEAIPKSRWKLTCSICHKRQGACIQCDHKHCFSAFHVTCAKTEGFCMRVNSQTSTEGVLLKAYCEKHTPHPCPVRVRRRRKGQRHEDTKVARAHQHHYSSGVPIVPDRILSKIDNLPCVKFSGVRKRQQLVTAIAHYWSLKRESRRGAPLLKRLHLEPWTANAKLNQDMHDLLLKKSFLYQLRTDLDRVRTLSEQVQKREYQKLERIRRQKDYLQMILFPVEHFIQPLLHRLMSIDRKRYFLNPVTAEEAPDYHLVIQYPMCFTDIQQKLGSHEYHSLDEFELDVTLIWQNAMRYNASDTGFYKVANKLKMTCQKALAAAKTKFNQLELLEDGTWNAKIEASIFSYDETIQETEEEKQARLERKRLREEERQRVIQKRVEGRARARAIRKENELKGVTPPTAPKMMRQLRARVNSKEMIPITDKQVVDLRVQQPLDKMTTEDSLITTQDSSRLQHELESPMVEFQPQYPDRLSLWNNNYHFENTAYMETRKRERDISTDSQLEEDISQASHPIEKEPVHIQAPVGWVYLNDDDEEMNRGKQKVIRQSRNGIPVPDFQRGAIVWARVDRYPSHPAKFLNYSDEEAGKLTASRRYQGDILVEFLKVPEIHRYGWVGRRTICGLGDPQIDRSRLIEALSKRSRRYIDEAKEGYRHAGALLGIDVEPILSSVFDVPFKKSKKRQHKKM